MRHPPFVLATLCVLLSGCWPGPQRPAILVSTTPPGASCTLSRLGQSIATAAPTPAIALVDPSESPITILCRRPGFADAVVTLPARKTEPGFGSLFGSPTLDNQSRVDIALRAARPGTAPR